MAIRRDQPLAGRVTVTVVPDIDRAFQRQAAAMQFHQLLGQRQAQAGAFIFARQGGIDLAETFQRLGNVLRRDADAGIGDRRSPARAGISAARDRAPCRRPG